MGRKSRTVGILGNVFLWGMAVFGWTFGVFEGFGVFG